MNSEPLEYAVKFLRSDLSLEKIEDLINQRNNIKIILEKTYESMNILMKRFNENEPNLNSFSKTPKNKYIWLWSSFSIDLNGIKNNNKLIEDNQKLKDILKFSSFNIENN